MESGRSSVKYPQPTSTTSSKAAFNHFDCLPDEVILVIVEDLRRDFLEPSSLLSFATVNQRIYNICHAILWEEIHLSRLLPLSLENLTNNILPKHGHCILSIKIEPSKDWFRASPKSLRQKNYIKASQTNSNKWSPHTLKRRETLSPENVTSILTYCPNLQKISLDFQELLSRRTFEEISAALDVHLPALVSNLSQLCHLEIKFSLELPMQVSCIIKTLSNLPDLKSLSLSNLSSANEENEESEMNELGKSISNLKKLDKLTFFGITFLNCSYLVWSTSSLIKELEIIDCHEFRALKAIEFINSFTPNLIKLSLQFIIDPWDDNFEELNNLNFSHYFNLPFLIELILWDTIECEMGYFNYFKSSLNLKRFSYFGLKTILKFNLFVKFICIDLNWIHLKSITLQILPELTQQFNNNHNNQVKDLLIEFCNKHQIQLTLLMCEDDKWLKD
ncbi:hypothetical protein CROQUDRAFT_715492 [Cronartium quercuum f. sp. fusiforme G11]|uniref:F-box domain-containing protein n=1 Tax=Cronartium quercuum f. sp. fusiforme G11 TaxID=708437 RepID=A0A9P6NM28_9BASI|nr:hypothetical protein CROQUDRAFT_715492 [Cronartium quercuum f. sp. fusiforme G11]